MGKNQNGDVSGTEMVSGRYTLLWQSGICAGEDIRLAGEPSRQHEMFGVVRQIFHWLTAEIRSPLRSVHSRHPPDVLYPAGRKTCLQVRIFDAIGVKSAFALLLTKVTKHISPQTSPVGSSLAGI